MKYLQILALALAAGLLDSLLPSRHLLRTSPLTFFFSHLRIQTHPSII